MNPPTYATLKSLELIHKLLHNIISDPYNDKYRCILLSNKTIVDKLLSTEGVLTFLLQIGFVAIVEK